MSSPETEVLARVGALLAEHDPTTTSEVEFLGAQYDAGLAWVHFEKGFGGLGLGPALQEVIDAALRDAGAPSGADRNPVGYGHGAGSVYTHGTDEQRRRWLRPLFTCEELWCQLFSEPGAGSDVAGLATIAVRDGDEWVVNGQKIWSSGAMHARWGILIARTDPTQPKHRGITFFVADMHAPGLEVRPIREMTGGAHFNETFFTDVRIPDAHRLGGVGMGWSVAVTTLMYERVLVSDQQEEHAGAQAIALWRARDDRTSPVALALRDRLVMAWVESEATRLLLLRAKSLRSKAEPGADGSLGKLAVTRVGQQLANLCVDLSGPDAVVDADYTPHGGKFGDRAEMPLPRRFLNSVSSSISGGTSEIMRNIIGERVLGLPGDIRVDKDVPWNEVRRS